MLRGEGPACGRTETVAAGFDVVWGRCEKGDWREEFRYGQAAIDVEAGGAGLDEEDHPGVLDNTAHGGGEREEKDLYHQATNADAEGEIVDDVMRMIP